MPDINSSKLLSMRVDGELKRKLEGIALESDRSITQLCKYAISDFFSSDAPFDSLVKNTEPSEDSSLGELVGIRLPQDLLQQLESVTVPEYSTSGVLRQILQWWIVSADLSVLGRPAQSAFLDKAGENE